MAKDMLVRAKTLKVQMCSHKRVYLLTEIVQQPTKIKKFNRLPTKIENFNRLPTKLLNFNRQPTSGPPHSDPRINVEVSFRRIKCHTGVFSSFYIDLNRKTPPERGIFFRLQVSMKEKGFHQLKFMKGQRHIQLSVSVRSTQPGPSNFHELLSDGVFMDQFILKTVLE